MQEDRLEDRKNVTGRGAENHLKGKGNAVQGRVKDVTGGPGRRQHGAGGGKAG